jgi:hypothetical protein
MKMYNDKLEMNTTKTRTKIHLVRDTIPERYFASWDRMEQLRMKLNEQRKDHIASMVKDVVITNPQEKVNTKDKFNIICKVIQVDQREFNQQ